MGRMRSASSFWFADTRTTVASVGSADGGLNDAIGRIKYAVGLTRRRHGVQPLPLVIADPVKLAPAARGRSCRRRRRRPQTNMGHGAPKRLSVLHPRAGYHFYYWTIWVRKSKQ
jgi:hypothetical protein